MSPLHVRWAPFISPFVGSRGRQEAYGPFDQPGQDVVADPGELVPGARDELHGGGRAGRGEGAGEAFALPGRDRTTFALKAALQAAAAYDAFDPSVGP